MNCSQLLINYISYLNYNKLYYQLYFIYNKRFFAGLALSLMKPTVSDPLMDRTPSFK